MKTYHIITIGCQMNYADSERLASRLEQDGYKKTHDKYGADMVVINTCGVRQSAENRIYGLIPRLKKESANRGREAKIILTGCLTGRKDVKRRLKDYVDTWLPIGQISKFKIPLTLSPRTAGRDKLFIKGAECDDYLEIKPNYESQLSALVPIGNGCDNFCSYCVVPYARGREVYRSAKDILDEVRGLVKRGYKEIILIAQNVNSYKSIRPPLNLPLGKGENIPLLTKEGRRGGLDFADLLKAVNNIRGDFWIRFLTSHPKDMSQKLIKTMAGCEKICRQIYLPVQAGDDGILRKMNRQYTAFEYVKLVEKIRKVLNPPTPPLLKGAIWQPSVSITTDLIVGFPGETRKQFNNSLKLFKKIKFDMAYISEYSARPGTTAFKLADNVSDEEKKKRKSELEKILRQTALANNKEYLGKMVRVLIESKVKAGEWFGKTVTGKDIRFSAKPSACQAGDFVEIKVTGVKEFCLAGILS